MRQVVTGGLAGQQLDELTAEVFHSRREQLQCWVDQRGALQARAVPRCPSARGRAAAGAVADFAALRAAFERFVRRQHAAACPTLMQSAQAAGAHRV